MKAEIITIGTEIMVGSILNTNSKYISTKLVELGIDTFYHTSVDDNEERLTDVINIALKRADIIITSGGLGPTQDDLTKEIVSKTLGLELVMDEDARSELINRFTRNNRHMTENNLKQAVRPKECSFIRNDNGTAPGVFICKDDKKVIMLPGPPRELIPMFENYVSNLIKDNNAIEMKSINTIGIGESSLETELKTLDIYEPGFEIATFAKGGTCEIKIIGKGFDHQLLKNKIEEKIEIIQSKLGEFIYGYDNVTIEEVVVRRLTEKGLMLSLCESCTGGMISERITSIPGASKIFDRGIVTYSNKAKIDELNVNPDTLKKYGAVSEETAIEMAKGLLQKTDSDIVVSITGIAGPEGGTKEKPVGLVYICVMNKKSHKVIKSLFSGNRLIIQERATVTALNELNKFF